MATWYGVYEKETGRLVSVGTEVADPLPDHLGCAEVEWEDDGFPHWYPENRTFHKREPEPVLEEPVPEPRRVRPRRATPAKP